MLAAGATRAEAALQGTTVSTSCDTSFSVQREGQQSQASCHHAEIASSYMHIEPASRLLYLEMLFRGQTQRTNAKRAWLD